jgi:glycosyltransferase involved in cell wall biosynthesis
MGFVQSDELIATAKGDFGLVWDGDSTTTCSGDFGEYLQYNNPHKTSLYLRCGLPVIIWDKAGLADFIRDNKVGLCIDSLEHLEEALSNVTAQEYADMKSNALQVRNRLQEGYHTRQALERAIHALSMK